MPLQRIDKILSSQNIASRSDIKEMIRKRRISADGKIVLKADEKFNPETAEIKVDGNIISFKKYLYVMMNKPSGVLSATYDKYDKTVLDILPKEFQRNGLFPAGRLDKDTEGFVLITDDGELAHKMLSPKNHVYKLYKAVVDKTLTGEDVQAFENGISLGEDDFLPASMKILDEHTALVEICEGKFHQVKKMFNAVGANVIYLKRLRIGGVFLDENLSAGECRELTEDEFSDILSKAHGI